MTERCQHCARSTTEFFSREIFELRPLMEPAQLSSMTDPEVRAATLNDVEFLSQTAYTVHVQRRPELSSEDKARWIEGFREDTRDQVLGGVQDSMTYVIYLGAERVGRLRVVRTNDRVFIAGIQILPEYQGKGIGTAVITTLQLEAAVRDVPIELKVSKDNPDAERLYTRLGFRRSGDDGDDYCMTRSPS